MEKDVPPIIDAHAEVVHDPAAGAAPSDRFTEIFTDLVNKVVLIAILAVAGFVWHWLYQLWFKIF